MVLGLNMEALIQSAFTTCVVHGSRALAKYLKFDLPISTDWDVVTCFSSLGMHGRETPQECMSYLLSNVGKQLQNNCQTAVQVQPVGIPQIMSVFPFNRAGMHCKLRFLAGARSVMLDVKVVDDDTMTWWMNGFSCFSGVSYVSVDLQMQALEKMAMTDIPWENLKASFCLLQAWVHGNSQGRHDVAEKALVHLSKSNNEFSIKAREMIRAIQGTRASTHFGVYHSTTQNMLQFQSTSINTMLKFNSRMASNELKLGRMVEKMEKLTAVTQALRSAVEEGRKKLSRSQASEAKLRMQIEEMQEQLAGAEDMKAISEACTLQRSETLETALASSKENCNRLNARLEELRVDCAMASLSNRPFAWFTQALLKCAEVYPSKLRCDSRGGPEIDAACKQERVLLPGSYAFYAKDSVHSSIDSVSCVCKGKRFGVAFALCERMGSQTCEFQMLAVARRADGSIAVFGSSTPMYASADVLSLQPALDLLANINPHNCHAEVINKPERVMETAGRSLQSLLSHYMQPSGLSRLNFEDLSAKCLSRKAFPVAQLRGIMCGM
tara:strand:+ start:192 stop:1850 length:1659 start_codon:yes stop_codon:yes gene_type:complete